MKRRYKLFRRTSRPVWTNGYKIREHVVCAKAKTEDPKVSVIVPIYNMEEKGYLKDTLSSLENQTLNRIELLLIDDCSTDNSLKILNDFAERNNNTTVIHSIENGRQGAARNLGIEYARGMYIGFVDGDDSIDKDYFKELYTLACRYDADIATAPFILTDNSLNPIGTPVIQFRSDQPGDITETMREEIIMSPAHIFCSIYKSSLFSECSLRFPEGVFFEDNPTCFRLMCQARSLAILNEGKSTPCYYYRQNNTSTDHRTDIAAILIRNRITTSNMLFDDALESGIYGDYSRYINTYYMQIALLNTLRKIKACNDQSEELINEVIDSIRLRLGNNVKISELAGSLRKKIQILLALKFPYLYLAFLGSRA